MRDREPLRPAYIETSHGRLHYVESGTGRRAILLFHETPLSSKVFAPLMPLLSPSIRVIAFDTPGYGGSSPPTAQPSIEGYGAAIWSAVQQLGLDEVAVCGIHTGATIGVELASAERPGPRIVGAVLSGVTVLDADGMAYLATFSERDKLDAEGAIKKSWQDRKQRWVRASTELLVQALADELEVFPRRNEGFKAVASYDIRSAIDRIKLPVLVLNGENDSMAKIDTAAVTLFRDGKLILLPGWGGQLQWSASTLYSEHVLEFLLPKFSVP